MFNTNKPVLGYLFIIIILMVIGGVLLFGCKDVNAGTESRWPSIYYDIDYLNHVAEFNLQDGTRCVAMYKGGITCQWK